MLEKIRNELVPDAGSVTANLVKMNIYEEGGHFGSHLDTPRSETHFGSLVVCLPSYHAGGELKVTHAGVHRTVDWGSQIEKLPCYEWEKDYKERRDKIPHHLLPICRTPFPPCVRNGFAF